LAQRGMAPRQILDFIQGTIADLRIVAQSFYAPNLSWQLQFRDAESGYAYPHIVS